MGYSRSYNCDQAGECDQTEFNAEVWRTVGTLSDPMRIRMVDDLIDSGLLLGKTDAEIGQLLGSVSGRQLGHSCDRLYWLDPERGMFSIDSEWLCLNFDHGRLVDQRIIRD
jgi:hypothetical protein